MLKRDRPWQYPVVRLDLRRVARGAQPERVEEAIRDRDPVGIGVRGDVRVVIADGAVELAVDADGREQLGLSLQPKDEIGDFLAERRRSRRLAMRAREHGHVGEPVRERAQVVGQVAHCR